MDGSMDDQIGSVDDRSVGWMVGWMDEWIDGRTHGWIIRWLNRMVDESMDRWGVWWLEWGGNRWTNSHNEYGRWSDGEMVGWVMETWSSRVAKQLWISYGRSV